MSLVTLLTDFGLRDGYVAQMKGVILKHCPNCQIVDLSHLVARHSIVEGAFVLESSVSYFPRETIHVAVVDPGVGTGRVPLVVVCRLGVLVGPDNGILSLAAAKLGLVRGYMIDESMMGVDEVSTTFHGRDVFAVAAGKLAGGRAASSLGSIVQTITQLGVPKPDVSKNKIRCTVLHVDVFGNLITNVKSDLSLLLRSPGTRLRIEAKGRALEARSARTYSDVRVGELAVLSGSQGIWKFLLENGVQASFLALVFPAS